MKKFPLVILFTLAPALLLVSGCGSRGGDAGVINLFSWSEYIPDEVINAFTEETGIRVRVENYASNEEMVAKLVTGGGQYDLIQPSDYTVEMLSSEGYLMELDLDAIPNLRNIADDFRNLAFDPDNTYSVPWMGGTVGIIVNTERITSPVTSYAELFSGDFAGRIIVVDDAREIVAWAFHYLDIPVNDLTPENLAQTRPVLENWLSQVKIFDSDSPKTALLNGDADLGIIWSGEAAQLIDEDEKFSWIIPSEGSHLFVDTLAIPSNAKNPEGAKAFIDFILRPEISAMISAEFPYTNPNAQARKLLSEEALANPASFPSEADRTRMELFEDPGEMASEVESLITDIRVRQS